MQVFCSNCNTAHEVTQDQEDERRSSVIHCRKCDKRIKLQFCPHCGSFYSITFSNIKAGRYRYRCRKCMNDFTIEFPYEFHRPSVAVETVRAEQRESPLSHPVAEVKSPEQKPAEKIEVASFISNGINSFSINELFAAAAGAFSPGKIGVSSAGVILMLLLLWMFSRGEAIWLSGIPAMHPFAGSLMALFPLAIIFSLYTATAAVVSRITLDTVFHGKATGWNEVIRFSYRAAPAVFPGNAALLLAISALLVLFGRIPLLGPILFSIVFLPVYILGIMITLLCLIGIWFYPPISAHREGSISGNMKNLFLFIKKHNLSLLYMIPVIVLVSAISFSVIFLIHTAAFSFTISLSRWLVSSDGGGVFASIPASFVSTSEATFAGLGSGLFRQLSINLGMTHHVSGFILGVVMIALSTLLLSIAVSITATVSSHIYIVMERGLTIDDKKKGAVFLILTLMLSVLLLLKKLV